MVSLLPPVQTTVPLPPTKISKPTVVRRGTIRKADDAQLDMDLLDLQQHPSKRPRVTFKEEVEERVLESFKPKSQSLDSVRAEVKRSVLGHLRGDSEGYDALKSIFSNKKDSEDNDLQSQEDPADVKTYLVALTAHASLLNVQCNGLVRTLLNFEWMGQDESTVRAYVQFLGSLASAQGTFIQSILDTLVKNFTGGKPDLPSLC